MSYRNNESARPTGDPPLDHEVVIIGAGFGGLGAGIELLRAGISDFVIVDKNDDIGGTWHTNTYPGVAVDIPSLIYSFSYARPRVWSRFFAPGAEVKQYAGQLADDFGLRSRLRCNTEIASADFEERSGSWRLTLTSGETLRARYLLAAFGSLEVPKLPDIQGISGFGGKIVHTARWDHDYDYTGKRIAVIGTGASALQVVPELARDALSLTVFQRTPIWVGPKPDFAVTAPFRFAAERVPGVRRLARLGTVAGLDALMASIHLLHRRVPAVTRAAGAVHELWYRTQVPDPELRAKLTPGYAWGCKRPSLSNRYLETFTREGVALVTDPISQCTRNAVVTAGGVEYPADVVICATGFQTHGRFTSPPFPLRGRDGVDLRQWWDEHRFQAYQGTSVPGYPNLFLITGPYGFGPGSYLATVECLAHHAVRVIREARRRAAPTVEIRQRPHEEYLARCQRRGRNSIWLHEPCAGSNTYYVNYQGDTTTIRPSTQAEMWWDNRHFPLDNYRYGSIGEVRTACSASTPSAAAASIPATGSAAHLTT